MKNKVLTALFSLAVAFGLWLYVITVVSPGSEATFYNIPVVFQGEGELTNRGLMIASEDIPTVTLKIAGNRSDLNNLNSSNITVIADVSKIWEAGTATLDYTVSYPGNIREDSMTIISKNPGKIELNVEERVNKTVNVVVDYIGSVPEGFICDKDNIEMDISTIRVTGPKPVVDQIESARIQVDLSGKTQTISDRFTYTLCDKDGNPVDAQLIETNADAVNVVLTIQRVKKIELVVEVKDGGGATAQTSTITVNPSSIMVSGSESLLNKMESQLVIGTIDLGMIQEDTEIPFTLELPEGITNETGINEVKVKVEFPDLGTKTLQVSRFQAKNVPAGMTEEFITQNLEIKIRGPKAQVEAITANDVTVVVDFADAEPGTIKLKAEVIFDEAFGDVGVLGSPSVTATLKES